MLLLGPLLVVDFLLLSTNGMVPLLRFVWSMYTLRKVEVRRANYGKRSKHSYLTKCCIFGDFNVVRKKKERRCCLFDPAKADDFNPFISRNDLLEVSMGARKFTRVGQGGSKLSKLDRFLLS